MDYYELLQARRHHEELINEARNEARIVAPIAQGENVVTRVMQLFKSVLSRRTEPQTQLPRHA